MSDAILRDSHAWGPTGASDEADRMARAFADASARSALGIYSFTTNEILIRPGAFDEFAELLDIPEVASEGQAMSVLLHEAVHAADMELFHCSSTLQGLGTTDAKRAYRAIVEGHAQFVARRLAERLGLSESFALYTASLSAPAKSSGTSGLQSGPAALIATFYEDGERFIQALYEDGGAEALRRAFVAPPEDLSWISHPEWFLRPATRPRADFDLDAGLEVVTKVLSNSGWVERRHSLSAREFAATFLAPLAEQEIEPIARALRQNRQLRTGAGVDFMDVEIALTVMEFDSAEDSARFLAAFSKVRVLRDEARKKGPMRVEGASYQAISDSELSGVLSSKTVMYGDAPVRLLRLCAAKGCVVADLVLKNTVWEQELLVERIKEVLRQILTTEKARQPQ